MLVTFWILTSPIISSPIFEEPIYLISNEIVTQTLFPVDRYTAVPAPASIIDAIYPPWVIPTLLIW